MLLWQHFKFALSLHKGSIKVVSNPSKDTELLEILAIVIGPQ